MKINIGCGGYPLDGYVNVDKYPPADEVIDFWSMHVEWHTIDEVRMDHFLEHHATEEAREIVTRVKYWLKPGGLLHVEVPDMEQIMAGNSGGVTWVQAVYGAQCHDGEFHKTGFTASSIEQLLTSVGYRQVETSTFFSDHPMRQGFPCLLAQARP